MRSALLFLVLSLTTSLFAQDALRVRELDRYLSSLQQFGFSGAVLVMHGDRVVLEKGYGLADRARRVPFAPDTLVDIGSIVKTFTALAIHQNVDAGKISLDDTLPKFFANVPEDKRAITVRQLLTHTAGLPLYTGDDYELVAREEMVRRAFAEKLAFEPGSRWGYCNSCYSILAVMLENLSGKTFEQYVHDHLLVPARMTETGYTIPNWLGRTIARGYRGETDDGTPLSKAWYGDGPSWTLRGNGGFLSTVRDLGLWARALRGTAVVSAAAKQRAEESIIDTGRSAGERMSPGWFVQETPQGRLVSHSGGNGFFGTNLRRYVDRDVTIVFTTNAVNDNILHERRAAEILFGKEAPALPEAKAIVPEATVARYAGRYRLPDGREIELRLDHGQLILDPSQSAAVASALARPSDARSDEKTNARAVKAIASLAAGDPAPLFDVLLSDVDREEERKFWSDWMKRTVEKAGAFVAAQPLWTVPADDGMHTWVALQFEKRAVIVRWEERAKGVYLQAFPPRRLPALYRFAPTAPDAFVTWNPYLDAAGTLRVEPSAIVFGSGATAVRATRVASGG